MKKFDNTQTLKSNILTGDKKNVVSFVESNGLRKSINPITFLDEKETNEKRYNSLIKKGSQE